jgi:hypothetical protein
VYGVAGERERERERERESDVGLMHDDGVSNWIVLPHRNLPVIALFCKLVH